MYYLLEDNRIIDSTISYTVNFPYWEIKDNCLFAKSKNDKLVRPCNENQIKKQSENVYDLIEVGDLLFLPFYCGDMLISRFDTFKRYENNLFYCWIHTVREKEIYAIYKPDEKGNFIKVWEVEEDE